MKSIYKFIEENVDIHSRMDLSAPFERRVLYLELPDNETSIEIEVEFSQVITSEIGGSHDDQLERVNAYYDRCIDVKEIVFASGKSFPIDKCKIQTILNLKL
jgi:hypothetical protein